MTSGNISKKIFLFSLPIVMGNIVQQLYNTADAMIVSKMISNNAFASVSVANPIMLVVLFFQVGLTLGMNTLLAREYGAGNERQFRSYYSTALVGGISFTVFISAICILFSGKLLQIVNTPSDIFDATNIYLKIVFAGLIFSFLYNFFANTLRALGDSRATFIFLCISSVINIFLDILLIKYTGLGVAGAAIATVISQGISMALCIIYIYKYFPMLRINPSTIIFDRTALGEILSYSWASAFQQTFLYLGRLIVQGTINARGIDMITGYNAAFRLESFALTYMEGAQAALATFVGQNFGARKFDRIRKGFIQSIIMALIYVLLLIALLTAIPGTLIRLYVDDSNIGAINIGVTYIKYILPGYLITVFTTNTQGLIRGLGKNSWAMRATILQMLIRCPLSIILVPIMGIRGVCYGCIFGWIVMSLHNLFLIIKANRDIPS